MHGAGMQRPQASEHRAVIVGTAAVVVLLLAWRVFVWLPGSVEVDLSASLELGSEPRTLRKPWFPVRLKNREDVAMRIPVGKSLNGYGRPTSGTDKITLECLVLLRDGTALPLGPPGAVHGPRGGPEIVTFPVPSSVGTWDVVGVRLSASAPVTIPQVSWRWSSGI